MGQFAASSRDLTLNNAKFRPNPTSMGCNNTTDHIACYTSVVPTLQVDTLTLPNSHRFQAILKTGDALAIGLALASVIYFGGKVSGGHFNPAVSFMMLLSNKIDITKFVAFIIAQVLGGTAAFLFHSYTK